jgi:hypothetical protein
MGKTYEPAGKDVVALIVMMTDKHHSDLTENGVTVGALFCTSLDANGEAKPSLKRHGHAVAAQIQITSLADRARGLPDAKLTIDTAAWYSLPENARLALIDHELEHLRLDVDNKGQPMADDIGRPKLKIRYHDWELGGFAAIVERHGESAVESMEIKRVRAQYEQLSLFA